jgi:AcrR family transcriptional regulator
VPPAKQRTPSLRRALVDYAVAGVEQDGLDALQARRLAAAVGTSTAAIYELFGDKQGLVRAVVFDGFRQLGKRLEAAPVSDDRRGDVVALLAVSRVFAADHPVLFDLMHSRPLADFQPSTEDRRSAAAVYDLVVSRIGRWLSDETAVDAAHVLVSLNSGLIARERAGVLGTTARSRNHRWRFAVDVTLDGLAHRVRAGNSS